MIAKLSIRDISLYGFGILIAGAMVSGLALLYLIFQYESILANQRVVEEAYQAIFQLKYDTERLLTTSELHKQRRTWSGSAREFQDKFDVLHRTQPESSQEVGRLWKVIGSEIAAIEHQLENPLFSKRNIMEKSLLRRLGEGFNANEQSPYYVAVRTLVNAIDYLQQYEDFLLDELGRLKRHHTIEASTRLGRTKLLLITLPITAFVALSSLAAAVFLLAGRIERNLLRSRNELSLALNELAAKQQHLNASMLRYRELFEKTPVGLWEQDLSDIVAYLMNLHGRIGDDLGAWWDAHPEDRTECIKRLKIVGLNGAALELHGLTEAQRGAEDFIGMMDGCLAAVFDAQVHALWNGIFHLAGEASVGRLDGGSRQVLIGWTALPDSNGNIERGIVSMLDITERKEAEENLQRSVSELTRSNTDLERFAYVASHDLKEPLRNVVSFAQLLEMRCRDRLDEEEREYLGYVVRGAQRMDGMISDLLAYSRIQQQVAAFERVDADRCLSEAEKSFAELIAETGARIVRQSLPAVTGNALQLTTVFRNLIGNGLKFRRMDVAPLIEVAAELVEGQWRFSVKDNGLGIEPKHHEDVFKAFKRVHGREDMPGSGMGLAICRRIIEHHGGTIWVESTPNEGSAVYFTLSQWDARQAR